MMSVEKNGEVLSDIPKETIHHHEDVDEERTLKPSLAIGTGQAWRPASAGEKAASRKLNRKLDIMVMHSSPACGSLMRTRLTREDPPTSCYSVHVQSARPHQSWQRRNSRFHQRSPPTQGCGQHRRQPLLHHLYPIHPAGFRPRPQIWSPSVHGRDAGLLGHHHHRPRFRQDRCPAHCFAAPDGLGRVRVLSHGPTLS